ncbi:MAG: nucleotidyltransferase domain-containing protein [Syntrophobacteraceae bacterium]
MDGTFEPAGQTGCIMDLEAPARQFGVKEIYVFGSRAPEIAARARGEEPPQVLPGSDVDIAVQPELGVSFSVQQRVRFAIALEDLFGVGRVDLVVLGEADPFLAVEIIRGELLYCRDPDDQAETELYVLRRAGDLAHHERERINSILT